MRDALRWLAAPATDAVPRYQVASATVLRLVAGLLWLYNVVWKRAPDFGVDAGNGLYRFTRYAVEYPVLPPYSWVVEHVVLEAFTPFGWLVLAVETALAVLLLTGTFLRLAAVLGIGQSLAIALSVAYAPGEWPWAYWMMLAIHVALLLSSAGRVLAVDAVRARLSGPERLGRVWGGLAVAVGLFGVVASLDDPLAARGARLGSTDPSVSLGTYNLVGGCVLLAVGVLLVLGARRDSRAVTLARGAVVVAVLAALSLYTQLGFTDPLLGGTPTSAAFLLCLAVIGTVLARAAPRRTATPP